MKGFSEGERERIRQSLIEAGREQFSRFGFKKTTVAELTDRVGIAEGTFYRFFDSKDELYWAVLDTERQRVETKYETAIEKANGPKGEMIALLEAICDEIETNPLVKASVQNGEFKEIVNRMSAEELEVAHDQKTDYIREFIDMWVGAGLVQDTDPDLIAGVFRAITFIPLHQEELGPEYPEIRDLLIRSTVTGLLRNNTN